jgi:hypothetical protein
LTPNSKFDPGTTRDDGTGGGRPDVGSEMAPTSCAGRESKLDQGLKIGLGTQNWGRDSKLDPKFHT